jgi:hypothetical protein
MTRSTAGRGDGLDNIHLRLQLGPVDLAQMEEDLSRCQLEGREKDILQKIVSGASVTAMARDYRLRRHNIYQLYKRVLVKIWRELGPRDWVRRQSKGKIEEWNITMPRSFRSAKWK